MKTRIGSVIFALALSLCVLPIAAGAADIPAKSTYSNGQPYYIMVNRKMNTVTVYGLDENGCYSVPVRAMVCSVGTPDRATPTGNFSIGVKHRWHLMVGNVYAQYLSQFHNACLFHSICYAKPDPSTALPDTYDSLGEPASHGCIRLQTEDAKWIYDNASAGTKAVIF